MPKDKLKKYSLDADSFRFIGNEEELVNNYIHNSDILKIREMNKADMNKNNNKSVSHSTSKDSSNKDKEKKKVSEAKIKKPKSEILPIPLNSTKLQPNSPFNKSENHFDSSKKENKGKSPNLNINSKDIAELPISNKEMKLSKNENKDLKNNQVKHIVSLVPEKTNSIDPNKPRLSEAVIDNIKLRTEITNCFAMLKDDSSINKKIKELKSNQRKLNKSFGGNTTTKQISKPAFNSHKVSDDNQIILSEINVESNEFNIINNENIINNSEEARVKRTSLPDIIQSYNTVPSQLSQTSPNISEIIKSLKNENGAIPIENLMNVKNIKLDKANKSPFSFSINKQENVQQQAINHSKKSSKHSQTRESQNVCILKNYNNKNQDYQDDIGKRKKESFEYPSNHLILCNSLDVEECF